MGTEAERDVYELDTKGAEEGWARLLAANRQYRHAMTEQVAGSELVVRSMVDIRNALDRLNGQMEESKRASRALAETQEGLIARGAKWIIGLNLAERALSFLTSQITNAFGAVVEDARAMDRLNAAVHQMGYEVGAVIPRLQAQAEELEQTRNVSSAMANEIQGVLLRFGATPAAVEKATAAIAVYAQAAGMDARSATDLLIRSLEGGKEEMLRLGIAIKDTGDGSKNLEAAAAALQKRWGGFAADTDSLSRSTERLGVAWENALKLMVGGVTGSDLWKKAIAALTDELERMNDVLGGSFEERLKKELAVKEARTLLASATEDVRLAQWKLNQEIEKGGNVEAARQTLEFYKQIEVASQKALAAAEGKPVDKRSAVADQVEDERRLRQEQEQREAAEKESDDRRKKIAEAIKRVEEQRVAILERRGQLMDEQLEEEARAAEEAGKRQAERIAMRVEGGRGPSVGGDVLHDRALAQLSEQQAAELELRSAHALAVADLERATAQELGDIRRQAFEAFVNMGVEAWGRLITTNHAYSRAMEQEEIKRRIIQSKEAGAAKSRAEIEKEMANERKAAVLKETASILAGISKQALIKAAFEAADAIAAAARYDFAGASMHAAAAAKFGIVAAVAGAGAYGISQARGMTREESQSLASVQAGNREQERADREKDQEKDRAKEREVGTTINVYYLGITGYSEAEQGAELSRIQQTYSNLRTGSGGL